MMMSGALTIQATEYNYLTIEKTDGTTQSMAALGLTITFSDDILTATNGTKSATIVLSEVSRMYFTEEDTSTLTAIDAVGQDGKPVLNDAEEVYDLRGHRLPKGVTPRKGVYIIKQNNKIKKVQLE